MNKKELIESISHLPSDCSRPRPMIDKLTTLELIKLLDEPQKVTVPQFVADWIEYCKEHNFTLFGCLDPGNGFESLAGETFEGDVRKCIRWCRKESNNFARAWLDGYTVEKEKRYRVKMKNIHSYSSILKLDDITEEYFFGSEVQMCASSSAHTRKELEEAGFGEVFNSPLFEVEEVTE
jgi:hypothetical protein